MDANNGKIAQLIVDKFKAEVWAELQLQALLELWFLPFRSHCMAYLSGKIHEKPDIH